MTDIKRLDSRDPGFREALEQLLTREAETDRRVETAVKEIITAVRDRGDDAVLDFTGRFVTWTPASAVELEVPIARCEQALASIDTNLRAALERGATRASGPLWTPMSMARVAGQLLAGGFHGRAQTPAYMQKPVR